MPSASPILHPWFVFYDLEVTKWHHPCFMSIIVFYSYSHIAHIVLSWCFLRSLVKPPTFSPVQDLEVTPFPSLNHAWWSRSPCPSNTSRFDLQIVGPAKSGPPLEICSPTKTIPTNKHHKYDSLPSTPAYSVKVQNKKKAAPNPQTNDPTTRSSFIWAKSLTWKKQCRFGR